MILKDKQSLIICAIVVFGFSISGIIGVLDNFVIVAVLLVLFLVIVLNLVTNKHLFDKDEETQDKIDKNETPLPQDETV